MSPSPVSRSASTTASPKPARSLATTRNSTSSTSIQDGLAARDTCSPAVYADRPIPHSIQRAEDILSPALRIDLDMGSRRQEVPVSTSGSPAAASPWPPPARSAGGPRGVRQDGRHHRPIRGDDRNRVSSRQVHASLVHFRRRAHDDGAPILRKGADQGPPTVRDPVACQAPATPWLGSITPPSAVTTTIEGASVAAVISRSMIQVPTIGCAAIAFGVASWAERWWGPRGMRGARRRRDRRARCDGDMEPELDCMVMEELPCSIVGSPLHMTAAAWTPPAHECPGARHFNGDARSHRFVTTHLQIATVLRDGLAAAGIEAELGSVPGST